MITITTIEPAHFAGLAQLQLDCYPTLGVHELMTVDHFAKQYEVFPEGQIVALDGLRVVGQGSGFFIDFDFDYPGHTFSEICAGFYFTNHDPDGDWYYGADISVHPDYRGQGIGKRIYAARKDVVERYNRRGIVAGGLIPDFAEHKQSMSVTEYVDKVIAGELFDSTLSFQLRMGFEVRGLLENYIEDSASDNWSTLIVWENAEYIAHW